MSRDIPGFYFDERRSRYFRIEPQSTAPQDAHWNATNIRKRQREALEKKHDARLKELKASTGIARSCFAGKNVQSLHYLTELGSFTGDRADYHSSIYNTSLQKTVVFDLYDSRNPLWHHYPGEATINSFVIASDRNSIKSGKSAFVWPNFDMRRGLGTVLAPHLGMFDPAKIDPSMDIEYGAAFTATTGPEAVSLPRNIHYHEGHNLLLVAGGNYLFQCPLFLGASTDYTHVRHLRQHHIKVDKRYLKLGDMVKKCSVAPQASRFICTVAGEAGAFAIRPDDKESISLGRPVARLNNPQFLRPLTQDTFTSLPNPDVIYVGQRSQVKVYDIRESHATPAAVYLASNSAFVNHLKAVDQNRFLLTDQRGRMAVYDSRWCPIQGRSMGLTQAKPWVEFPDYRSLWQEGLGLDLDRDSGVVAAAKDDGSVGIYSVHSGEQLDCKPMTPGASYVKCIQFHNLTGRALADLYIGHTANSVTRYAYDGGQLDDDEYRA